MFLLQLANAHKHYYYFSLIEYGKRSTSVLSLRFDSLEKRLSTVYTCTIQNAHLNLIVGFEFLHKCVDINLHMVVSIKVQIVGIVRLEYSSVYRNHIVRVFCDDRQNSTIRIESKAGTTFFRFALRTVPRLIRFCHQKSIECVVVDHQFLFAPDTDHVLQLDL